MLRPLVPLVRARARSARGAGSLTRPVRHSRLCHNENEDHEIDRFATREIVCLECRTRQPVSNRCVKCAVTFGEYFCGVCKLWKQEDNQGTFHCKSARTPTTARARSRFHLVTTARTHPLQARAVASAESASRSSTGTATIARSAYL